MARSPLILPALLVCLAGLALGTVAMLRQPAEAASLVSVADHQGPASGETLPQGHVYCGVTSEPEDVNPFTSHSTLVRRFVLGLTHEGLLDTDPVTGALRGAVAESWELAADGMACTFRLREGVRFSDGQPVTMSDVLFGWELASAGHLPLGFVGDAYSRVDWVEVVDGRTLRVTFKEPCYAAVRAVGETWIVAARRFFLDRVAAICRRLEQPVPDVSSAEFAALLAQIERECGPGTGPFQLPSDADGPTTWHRRRDLSLVRNPYHWRRSAEPGTWNLDGMRLLFREGPASWNAVVAGEVDWAGARSVDEALKDPEIAANYRKLAYDYETLGVVGFVWNCGKAPCNDPRVRRALAMLVDRDAVVAAYPDIAVPAMAFAKPGSPSYPTDLAPLGHDPRAAKRLLREAGFDPAAGRPLRLSLLTVSDGGPMDLAVDLLVSAARGAGVEIAPETLPFAAYVARKKEDRWDGLLVNRSFRPWGDPFDFVHSEGLDNDGHWRDEDADRLAAAARAELDAQKREALWRELHALVYREQPFAFLFHPRACILFNKHIEGAEPGPRGLWPERWWVPREYQRR